MAVYQTDWYNLSVSTQKSLLFIMMRSLRPLKFTAGYFIDVSLNSYNQVKEIETLCGTRGTMGQLENFEKKNLCLFWVYSEFLNKSL